MFLHIVPGDEFDRYGQNQSSGPFHAVRSTACIFILLQMRVKGWLISPGCKRREEEEECGNWHHHT